MALLVFVALIVTTMAQAQDGKPGPGRYFVALDGNDAWSGTLPAPNAAKADGPFATVGGARDAVRAMKAAKGLTTPVTVMVRAGTYCLSEPLRFTPEDSGTEQCPIAYRAYPGEKVVLSGGRRITGWTTKDGQVLTAHVPEVKQGKLHFRLLRAGEQPLIRARYPNYDPENPIQGGWLFARKPPELQSGFGTSVAAIHNVGDYLEYEIDAPATADYDYWAYVAMKNKPHTTDDISGKTAITVDDGEPVPLMNMADTGDWHAFQWRRAARVRLTLGRHRLRWQNLKGGGINFDAFALTDDPTWSPTDVKLPPVAAGRHLLVVQAEAHVKAHGPQMRLDVGKALETKTELYVDRGALRPWPKSREAEIHIFPRYGWVNVFVEAKTSQVEFYDSRPEGRGNKFQRNIVCYAGPDGSALHLLQWRKDFVDSDYNLFFRVGGKLDVLTTGAQRRPWDDWLALGMDAHSLVADPLFVDPAADDYRLKPDSPAFQLGFQPIPVEKIGLKGYEGAWRIESVKP